MDGIRTVHFSDDGKKVVGDWDDLVEWDIESGVILSQTEIPGYTINKSTYDGDSFWMNGNSNYNTDKKDISDMHDNINISDSSGMTAHRTEGSYGFSALIKGTKDVVILAFTEKYTYQVVRLNIETFEVTTLYYDENRDGTGVPTAIKVSEDGKYVGVSMAGESRGLRVYDIEKGTLVYHRKTQADANDFAFSGDGNFVFVNDGASSIQMKTSDWSDVRTLKLSGTITSLDVNSDGTLLVAAFQKKNVSLINAVSGALEASLTEGKAADVTFSDNDLYVGIGLYKTLNSPKSPSIILYKIVK
jgi:hypothetical protein